MKLIAVSLAAILLSTFLPVPAQAQSQETPILKVTLVSRTIPAVQYRQGGETKVDFRGTPLLPSAKGQAKVESKKGYIEILGLFSDLEPATKFGPEYLTYVLWAVTPQGRPENLGELVLTETNNAKLNVTTKLQTFGMVVTAEPYYAVTEPSDVVVLENEVRPDTAGKIEPVQARYELLPRGQYVLTVDSSSLPTRVIDKKVPLELYQARNAVALAKFSGADRYASDSLAKANQLLMQAENAQAERQGQKVVATAARAAVQNAHEARLLALRRLDEERLAQERRDAPEREARAKAEAGAEAQKRVAAERQAEEAERRAELEIERQRTEQARMEAERARTDAEKTTQRATQEKAEIQAKTEAEGERRLQLELERQRTEQARLDAERGKREAEAARDSAVAQQKAAEAETARVRGEAEAQNEKAEMRQQLQQQLSAVIDTRDTVRGLIVNMTDVVFDTGSHMLRAGARENLTKIATIVKSYPDLKLEIEGHTDSVGSDLTNERLSEARAAAVRDYLAQQGVPPGSIIARGLGESQPVASNDSPAGRQMNRRVELVVTGEAIGER